MPITYQHIPVEGEAIRPAGWHQIASIPDVQTEGGVNVDAVSALEHAGSADAEVVLEVAPTGQHEIASEPTVDVGDEVQVDVVSALQHRGSAETSVEQTASPTGQHAILGIPQVATGDTAISVVSALEHRGTATVSLPYSESFHSGGVSVSASACTSLGCETSTAAPTETDSSASGAQGKTLTVESHDVTLTQNASGTVTVRELDGSGSVIDTHSAGLDVTTQFDFTADPNVQQLEVEADLTANSQNVSGDLECSVDSDCTNETAEIASGITISE